jgi:flagellar hook-associated protein 2
MAISPINVSGSGLDVNSIIAQLMEIEKRPLLNLQKKEVGVQAKISAYGTLLSAVSNFKSSVTALKATSLMGMTASVSDTTYMTATSGSSATAGNYSIAISSLAAAQSLYSMRFGSQNSKVADLSSVTTQKIKIQVGSNTAKEISVTSSNNTLTGIKDAINAAGAGVTAAVVKENSKFVISSSNNTIIFNDGTNKTATITAGTYTGSELATAIQTALNTAGSGFTVSHDSAASKFSITNSVSSISYLWGNSSTTAEQILGFDPVTDTVAISSSATSDDLVDGTYKLTITSDSTGASNSIKVQIDENNNGTYEESGETDTVGLSSLAYNSSSGYTNMTESQAASDASITVNGLAVSRTTNSLTDVITDVTLNLVKVTSSAITLTVSTSSTTLKSKVTSFVSSYNQLMGNIKNLRGDINKKGVLSGDSTTLTMSNLLRSVITTKYNDKTLASLGLSHDKSGTLVLNSTILDSEISSSSANVTTTLNKMAESLESSVTDYVSTIIPARKNGYQESMKSIQKDKVDFTRTLDLTETALRVKFTALEKALNQLQGTSNYLTQQMASIGKIYA